MGRLSNKKKKRMENLAFVRSCKKLGRPPPPPCGEWSGGIEGVQGEVEWIKVEVDGEDLVFQDGEMGDNPIMAYPSSSGNHFGGSSAAARDPLSSSTTCHQDGSPRKEKVNICLLCANPTTYGGPKKGGSSRNTSVQDADFSVMFILKKILEVPRENFLDYLASFGEPRNWIAFCGECMPKIKQALAIQKKINECEIKLRNFQKEVKETVSRTFVRNRKKMTAAKDADGNRDPLRVTKETWRFVGKDIFPEPAPVKRAARKTDDDPKKIVVTKKLTDTANVNVQRMSNPKLDTNWSPRFNKNGALAEKGYTCQLCPRLAPMQLESFVKHITFHNGHPHRCSVCDTYFARNEKHFSRRLIYKKPGVKKSHLCSKESLVQVSSKPEVPMECGYCQEIFQSEPERSVHEKKIHSQDESTIPLPHDCSKCSKSFRDHAEWRLHRALEHPELAKLGCFYCDETFAVRTKDGHDLEDTASRTQHMMEVHETRPRIGHLMDCDFCGANFSSDELLRDHVAADHGRRQFLSCAICSDRKDQRSILRHHWYSVHGATMPKDKLFCDLCGYETVLKSVFQEHNFLKHGISPDGEGSTSLFSCTNCSFKCTLKKSLLKHIAREHSAQGRYKCNTCGKGFLKADQLSRHQTFHLREPLVCDLCGYKTQRPGEFKHHKLMKHGIEPEGGGQPVYSCSQKDCTFKYTRKSELRFHMMKEHNTERCFKCETCGKGFLTTDHLQRHRDIHINSGVKPFQCEICGNSFAVRNYLYIHMRLSHQNRPFASTNKKRSSKKTRPTSGNPSPPSSSTLPLPTTHVEYSAETPFQTAQVPQTNHGNGMAAGVQASTAVGPELGLVSTTQDFGN